MIEHRLGSVNYVRQSFWSHFRTFEIRNEHEPVEIFRCRQYRLDRRPVLYGLEGDIFFFKITMRMTSQLITHLATLTLRKFYET